MPEDLRNDLLREEVRSCVVAPLVAGDKLFGVLGDWSKEFLAFKREHMQVLIMVADEAALALENARQTQSRERELMFLVEERTKNLMDQREKTEKALLDTEEARRELETLDSIVKTINREIALESVLSSLLEQAMVLFPKAQIGSFLLLDRAGTALSFNIPKGASDNALN